MGKISREDPTDYWDMLFQLSTTNKYSDSYLLSLKPKQIEKMYREKVENDETLCRNRS